MCMELSNNIDLDDAIVEDSFEPDIEDFTLTWDSGGKVPLCHSMHPHIKESSKHEAYVADEFKSHIDRTLNDLLGAAVKMLLMN